jgi:hypothetical protein
MSSVHAALQSSPGAAGGGWSLDAVKDLTSPKSIFTAGDYDNAVAKPNNRSPVEETAAELDEK